MNNNHSSTPPAAMEADAEAVLEHLMTGKPLDPEVARRVRQRSERATMRIAGKRIKRTRLIQTARYVVAVEVEMVVPDDDPSEPCYEAETVKLLREITERAEKGDVEWLKEHGRVYVAMDAA